MCRHDLALRLQDSVQSLFSSVCTYTNVHDEFIGQSFCQAGDSGPPFLQKFPAREDNIHVHLGLARKCRLALCCQGKPK